MPWEPPTEDDFNRQWVMPKRAHELLLNMVGGSSARRRYIIDRLKSGLIIAVARDAESRARAESYTRRDKFAPIPPHYWDLCGEYGNEHFWATGDQTFEFSDLAIYRFLDIRFPPDWYAGSPGIERPESPATNAILAQEASKDERKPPSKEDARRLCRAILSEWPEATEDWLREKAAAFFPNNKVTRDWFRDIIREIRGPGKRGRRPKTP